MELSQSTLDRVAELTEADSVGEPKQVSQNVWSVEVAYKDGPTAYRFDVKLFDLRDGEVHIWGF